MYCMYSVHADSLYMINKFLHTLIIQCSSSLCNINKCNKLTPQTCTVQLLQQQLNTLEFLIELTPVESKVYLYCLTDPGIHVNAYYMYALCSLHQWNVCLVYVA